MYLTKDDERILKGEYGEVAKKLMEILVRIGEIEGAERLIDVATVHTASSAILKLAGLDGIELLGLDVKPNLENRIMEYMLTLIILVQLQRNSTPTRAHRFISNKFVHTLAMFQLTEHSAG